MLDVPEGVTVPEAGLQTLQAAEEAGAVTLNYGEFFNSCLTLLIVAIAMFAIIRVVNRLDKQLDEVFGEDEPPPDEPTDKTCEFCRSTIPYRATRCPQCTSEFDSPRTQADAAAAVLPLEPTAIGRPLSGLPGGLGEELEADARLVFGELSPDDREVETEDGAWYRRRVVPYRNRIRGKLNIGSATRLTHYAVKWVTEHNER